MANTEAVPDLEIVKDDGSTVVVEVKGAPEGKFTYGIPKTSLGVRFTALGIEPIAVESSGVTQATDVVEVTQARSASTRRHRAFKGGVTKAAKKLGGSRRKVT